FDNAPVATPTVIEEDVANKDNGQEQTLREQTNTLSAFGLNVAWDATDRLSFALDVNQSSMDSAPTGPNGVGEVAMTYALPNLTYQTINFSPDLPDYSFEVDDTTKGNNNGIADIPDVGSQILRTYAQTQETDLLQLKLDGQLEFDNGRFQFGIESRDMEVHKINNGQRYMALGDWGVAFP